MSGLKIANKVMKAFTFTKTDAKKKMKKLQRESPNAAFRIFGTKGSYTVYQVWYDRGKK